MTSVPNDPREERRIVTALFADLAGSTALGERLDPEELKLIVADAVARMIDAIEAFGGTIKDLAGDGVLALFGAPVAHEDDPERAIRAGLRIVEDVAAFAREVEAGWDVEGFGVRVGIETGQVVVGAIGAGSRVEYAALGDAVNTAARLQAHAERDSVLVGQETRRMLGTRMAPGLFRWDDPVDLELKGKAEPVRASVVRAAGPVAPSRARGLEGVETRLIGRERDLAAAREVLDEALAGAGGVLYLVGEPGIGKTRLLAEVRALAGSESPTFGRTLWLEGRCVSYGDSLPYWPFRDLLRSWLGAAIDEPALRVRVTLHRQVERLFGDRSLEIEPYLGSLLGLPLEPDVAARVQELSPEALQYRTFEVVRHLLTRLAEDGPVVVALEDLHWADPTSLQLLERLLGDTETSALLLILTTRPERDHPSWAVKETAARDLSHRTRELDLVALSGDGGRDLLHALVGAEMLPATIEERILEHAEGNPFYLEELVRSLVDAGALLRAGDGWRFDHEVHVEIPPTVEKVILARIDRLAPEPHGILMAASVLGRQFGLPLLEAVAGDRDVGASLIDLQRLDLIREGRRWPDPEYRFKHALIQETAYRTLVAADRNRLHRKAAEWLEERHAAQPDEVAGLLAYHWLGADDEDKAIAYLTRAGDRARQEYALDEAIGHYRDLLPLLERRGERREVALVLFKLALALHVSLRFREANDTYQRAFAFWDPPQPRSRTEPGPSATLRVATSFLPNDADPRSAIAWPNIQLCMQLFDRLVEQWPERTIVPGLAERWEISDDGLRYVFHLREGPTWSDGEPLTAHDVEFGIKRVLDPDEPGSSVAIYFVLENGQDHYLRRTTDPGRIGVRALDGRTVEFRLVSPAPYFMSVMNRPDGGPQPRHAIEAEGSRWTDTGRQVVSGSYRVVDRADGELTLERREDRRPGNVARVEYALSDVTGSLETYERDEVDLIAVRYTPRLADLVPWEAPDASLGPAAWSGYLAFDHRNPATANLELRRALAYAVDRAALREDMPVNMIVATGGVVPPALQGHTPDIALRFDPDRAREHLARAGDPGPLAVAVMTNDEPVVRPVLRTWREVLGLDLSLKVWTYEEAISALDPWAFAPIVMTGWLPGYPDPEYFLRLLFQSESKTNEGGFAFEPFDELIERARREPRGRERLELFHEADRMVVVDRVGCIPLVYGRSLALVKPWVRGWWEFGKSSASFADLVVDPVPTAGSGATPMR